MKLTRQTIAPPEPQLVYRPSETTLGAAKSMGVTIRGGISYDKLLGIVSTEEALKSTYPSTLKYRTHPLTL